MAYDEEKSQLPSSPTSDDETARVDEEELIMDQGLVAWLQVLGSWILFANTWYDDPIPAYAGPDKSRSTQVDVTQGV